MGRRSYVNADADALLGLVEALLLKDGGRPRKLPGKARARAVDVIGNPIHPKSYYAYRWSLAGALERVRWEMGRDYPKDAAGKARKAAIEAIIDASGWMSLRWKAIDKFGGSIQYLDDAECDDRQIIRIIRRARRQLTQEGTR